MNLHAIIKRGAALDDNAFVCLETLQNLDCISGAVSWRYVTPLGNAVLDDEYVRMAAVIEQRRIGNGDPGTCTLDCDRRPNRLARTEALGGWQTRINRSKTGCRIDLGINTNDV